MKFYMQQGMLLQGKFFRQRMLQVKLPGKTEDFKDYGLDSSDLFKEAFQGPKIS